MLGYYDSDYENNSGGFDVCINISNISVPAAKGDIDGDGKTGLQETVYVLQMLAGMRTNTNLARKPERRRRNRFAGFHLRVENYCGNI